MRSVLFFLILLTARDAFARGLPTERMKITAGSAVLNGMRFLRADGRPNTGKWVIFTHGLGSNYHEFEYLIPLFMAAGYDCFAFNFRGHGNGDERSLIANYQNGDYRMEKMAGEDFPAIVREVQRIRGGERGIIVGHSMGGMNPRGAFALGAVTKDQIESMILLGSPPHFDSLRADRNTLNIFGLMKLFEFWLNSGRGDSDIQLSMAETKLETLLDITGIFNIAYWYIRDDVKKLIRNTVTSAIGEGDMGVPENWMKVAMSDAIPTDILRSFAGFVRNEYPYKDVQIPVPILHIMGGRDILVRHADIAAHAGFQSEDAGYWLAKVEDIGHLGLVTPKAINAYRDTMFDFLATEGNLGSSHKSYFNLAPSCEQRLADRARRPN